MKMAMIGLSKMDGNLGKRGAMKKLLKWLSKRLPDDNAECGELANRIDRWIVVSVIVGFLLPCMNCGAGEVIGKPKPPVSVVSTELKAGKEEKAEGSQPSRIFRDCSDCPEMVVIPSGSFDLGSNTDGSENPAHRATFAKPFAIGKYEVTQAQWRAVLGGNPSHFKSCGGNCPVESVSWDDIQEFIKRFNQKTGKQYRLPTQDEWEYACYGGSKTTYCGDYDIDSVAWYSKEIDGVDPLADHTTHPVGQKQPNDYGASL